MVEVDALEAALEEACEGLLRADPGSVELARVALAGARSALDKAPLAAVALLAPVERLLGAACTALAAWVEPDPWVERQSGPPIATARRAARGLATDASDCLDLAYRRLVEASR